MIGTSYNLTKHGDNLPFIFVFQAYLEAFYKFCSNLGGTTADTMCPILEVSSPFKHTCKFMYV